MIGFNKKKIGFIVDSSSNIKLNDFDDVKVVPLGISVNEDGKISNYQDDPSSITWQVLKEKLVVKKTIVKTSQANINQMLLVANEMVKKYDIVVVLPIHRKLSGNANSWLMLKNELGDKLWINFVDDVGYGYVWDIQMIKNELKKKEYNEKQLQDFIDQEIAKTRVGFLIVNDISRLIAGGRIKNSAGFIAKLLKIKPIILYNHDGLNFLDKTKSFDDYFQIVKNYLNTQYKNMQPTRAIVFVPEDYKQNDKFNDFYELFKKTFGNLNHVIKPVPNVIACHTGHDFFACYFEVTKK